MGILRKHKSEKGSILLLGIVIMAILMTMSASVWGYTMLQVKASKQAVLKSQLLHLAEAGLDHAIYELNQDSSYTGGTVSLGEGEYVTSIATIDSNNKRVTSTAFIPNSSNPKDELTVEMDVTIDLSQVAFNFGVQVGTGGLLMDNNSEIIGNVYSNGNITGGPGGNGTVTGDAIVAGGGAATADRECTTTNGQFDFNSNSKRDVAQKFTPTVTGPLTKISVYLKKIGSPNDITLRVYTNSGSAPGTQIGSSGSIASSTVTSNFGWIDGTFTSSPQLTSGVAYWLVLDTSSTATNYYSWASNTSQSCTGSTARYTSNVTGGSPSWTDTNSDMNFATYMGGDPTYIDGIVVNGDARAHSLTDCTIGGDAYYDTTNTCTVTGTSNSGEEDAAPQAMPISQAQIDEWKSVATAGGTISGPYTVSGTESIGPKKISGDLTVTGTLYLTGPIWVDGDITLDVNSSVIVDASLGNAGTVLLADSPGDPTGTGFIDIQNNVVIEGNNFPGSYSMIVSTKSGDAMAINNNSEGAIFYAANGVIDVFNNAGGSQVTGFEIHLAENATITYDTGLQSASFANGPGGSWAKVAGTYIILD